METPTSTGPKPAPSAGAAERAPNANGAPLSLEDVHSTVPVSHPRLWRRLFAFAGPAYLVSVGYMDPGNWATDIEGGAKFRYELLWVLLMSNGMAILLQTLAARLGIVTGRDLAQACRENYSRPVGAILWILCEIAIAACDLAEVIGTVVGLQLLFNLPPLWGLLITTFDTFLFLAIQRLGIRKMEAFILVLVATIGFCFLLEIALANPDWPAVARGLVPPLFEQLGASGEGGSAFFFSSGEALFVAVGILGATVMPHNLYLHSALVQSRQIHPSRLGLREACKYNLIDSAFALNAAFFVNAAILVMAAAAFHDNEQVRAALRELHPGDAEIKIQLQDAYLLLGRVLGTYAPMAFAIALLCSGQSSTLTGTLAGQVVMEGFVHIRIRPWIRRLLTRLVAIVPAGLAIVLVGESSMMDMLILSQVVLSMQLPFAVIPLLQFTSDRRRMGEFANPRSVKWLGWIVAAIIVGLNGYLVTVQIGEWIEAIESAGGNPLWLEVTVIPVALGCAALLAWLVAGPWLVGAGYAPAEGPAAQATAMQVVAGIREPIYRRIGVAVDHSPRDTLPLRHATALARAHGADLVLIHVVEGVGGRFHGRDAADEERRADQAYLEQLAETLRQQELTVRPVLRFGDPAQELSQAAAEELLDLLVMGSHGHGFISDWLFGETTGTVRHAVRIPVLAVREPG
jgi:manganese transport protein